MGAAWCLMSTLAGHHGHLSLQDTRSPLLGVLNLLPLSHSTAALCPVPTLAVPFWSTHLSSLTAGQHLSPLRVHESSCGRTVLVSEALRHLCPAVSSCFHCSPSSWFPVCECCHWILFSNFTVFRVFPPPSSSSGPDPWVDRLDGSSPDGK